MANSYFQFKQFLVNQDKAAMKVGTDGVLLGSWVSVDNCEEILDVGTGTGLLALMLAQRNQNAKVSAIDIEPGAVQQADENFKLSPWESRLSVDNITLQAYAKSSTKQFDLIICNPPFFKSSLKSSNDNRNLARHNDALPFNQLISCAHKLSCPNGRLAVIIPADLELEFLEQINPYNYNLIRKLNVKPTPKKPIARVLLEFCKGEGKPLQERTIIVEDKGRHAYSDDFKNLMKEFYLNF
ncbi:tRNA1(Val) (adenine(37)-N6)-methyltransferase [Carboxylicivirga sp. N1Y90]|uniref:tRNA1(Val) (adenine(37)-N6)-methyltransferase n=1 Tax=Carboxylicivirga fragile TaxID=3417571 RepID=UPI003D3447EA|nr:methyltransferase [Marinilabiliaceae bacterium N1Y90]